MALSVIVALILTPALCATMLIRTAFTAAGFSSTGTGRNRGMVLVQMKDWSERKGPQQSVNAIIGRVMGHFSRIKEAQVYAFNPPISSC